MDKRTKVPHTVEATFLSLHFTQCYRNREWIYEVAVERPERQGDFQKTWTTYTGLLPVDRAQDLVAYASKTILDAMLAWNCIDLPADR